VARLNNRIKKTEEKITEFEEKKKIGIICPEKQSKQTEKQTVSQTGRTKTNYLFMSIESKKERRKKVS